MRLVLFTRSLDLGGAERQLVTLAIELKRRQHDVEVLTMYGGGVLTNDLEQAGVPVCSLEKRGRWHLLGVVAQLVRYLRQRRPPCIAVVPCRAQYPGGTLSSLSLPDKNRLGATNV